MERRALLAAALSVLVIIIWQQLFFPPPPKPTDASSISPAPVAASSAAPADTAAASSTAATTGTPTASAADVPPAPATSLERVETVIDGPLYKAVFTTEGGGLQSFTLKHYVAYREGAGILESIKAVFGQAAEQKPLEPMNLLSGPFTNATPFRFDKHLRDESRHRLVSHTDNEVVYELSEGPLLVTKRYQLDPNDQLLKLTVTLRNQGGGTLGGHPGLVVRGAYVSPETGHYAPSPVPAYYVGDTVKFLRDKDIEETPVQVSGELRWAAISDKYFLRAVFPAAVGAGAAVLSEQADRGISAEAQLPAITLNPGNEATFEYQLYLGPKITEKLASYNRALEKSKDFGMWGVFAEPILWLLKKLYGFVHSWGLAIMLLTLIIKTVLFPLFARQMESAQRMKEFQPQLAELREKYKDNRDQLNLETMKFMQENKINPLGGCLPMLVQMPIWIALYNVLQDAIELYHTPFLYLPDLSVRDPYGLSPLILGALMFLQQRMTPPAPGMDPVQARMLQYMPLIFAGIMFNLPSGLVVYILVNTIMTILQQWYINRKFEKRATAKA